jgi:hypothetical protein
MAITFELVADCIESGAAEAFGAHFLGITYTLPDGRECRIGPAEIVYLEDEAHHVRCVIMPSGAGLTGYNDILKSDDERRGLAYFLYDRLRTAPPFRFAIVGFKCHDNDPFDPSGALDVFDGLVVSEQLITESARPAAYRPFSPGYFWIPITNSTRL